MRLPIPGPSELVHGVGVLRDGIGEALELLPRMVTLVGQAEGLIDRVGRMADKIEETTSRAEVLLALYEDSLQTMAPTVATFANSIEPAEVQAMVQLVDRLPTLVEHLDEDVIPILATLDRVAPDLHQLLEIAQDLQVALGGVPGMGWLRKRADKEEEEAEQEAQQEAQAIAAATAKPKGRPTVSGSTTT